MRIALDATYSLGQELSGIGVYSREILHGLAAGQPDTRWDWFYRSHRFRKALRESVLPNVSRRFLSDLWGNRSAALFHGLNQRLPRRRFRRQVATFHDLFVLTGEYSTPDFRARFALQARQAAAAADLIIAVSAFTANQVEDLLDIPGERIRVIHHGVIARPIPDLPREKVVLTVGALQKRKNQQAVVAAFSAMPPDWTLVLAGSAGYGSEEVVEAIRNSPARSRIQVLGYTPEEVLTRWYARASLFVFPSLDEGFGMPVLEAMAAGIPVISSNRSALPEVCGEAAWLVNPENIAELKETLVELAKNQQRQDEFRRRGFAHAACFTWQKAIAATAGVYSELLG